MKVFIDSNVIISAARNSNGKPFQAFWKAVTFPNTGVICEQNIDEIRRIFNRKFPHQIPLLEHFWALALPLLTVLPVPVNVYSDETKLHDADDRPLLRTAINANVDIFITGDKGILKSNVEDPKIMTPAEFLQIDM
jgi:putative PIN family toxin of toxin-antitoxin system